MVRYCFNFCWVLLCVSIATYAQKVLQIDDRFEKVSLAPYVFYEVDYLKNQPFEKVKRSFQGMPIDKSYLNFDDSPYPHWVRFRLKNVGHHTQHLSLVTKGVDSLEFYITNANHSKTLQRFVGGGHLPFNVREIPSPFLSISFDVQPDSTYWVWVRIQNLHYRLAASPFELFSQAKARQYIFQQHFLYSLFIGSMFLFLLLGVFLVYFFKERIYGYYLGCILCAFCIMLTYNDYAYLVVNHLPSIFINKNILGILSASVPVFYLLFAEQFLEINPIKFAQIIKMSRIIIAIQYLLLFVLVIFQQPLFEYKTVFYVFMGGLSCINLFYLVTSWPSPQSKLFIFATLPVTITVMLETLSNLHQWPVQNIHNTYYLTTLIELIALTAGLVYRFKQNEKEKYQLQNMLIKVGFDAQREERNLIADEMHDDIGASLVAAKQQIELSEKYNGGVDWKDIYNQINAIYGRVRALSYQLRSDDNYDLQSLLIDKYKSVEKVDLTFEGLDGIRFAPEVEVVLFNIISEMISNAIKHAQCTYIGVQLNYNQPEMKIIVEDNGVGFDLKSAFEQNGQGLKSIDKRVFKNLKGEWRIDTGSKGTVVIVKTKILPVEILDTP